LAGLGVTDPIGLASEAEMFLDDLYHANRSANLTRVPREAAMVRHVLDSLLMLDLVPVGARVLDLGTGPGFPAWPLAAARPDVQVTALDSNGKMLAFLRRHPRSNLHVVPARAEEWPTREEFDVVTGRALAPLAIQLELSAGPATVGGTVVPLRTPSDRERFAQSAAQELGLAMRESHSRRLPGTAIERWLPIFEKVAPTPDRYPRPWAEIKRRPLA